MDSVDSDPVGCAPANEEGQVSQHEQILMTEELISLTQTLAKHNTLSHACLLLTLCPHPIVGSALQYTAP